MTQPQNPLFTAYVVGIGGVVIASIFIFLRVPLKPYKQVTLLTAPPCTQVGPLATDAYLPTYTVVTGDTLVSLAKSKLGDPDRAQELITLNQARYPDLSINKPFLEKGWTLRLPPAGVSKTNGLIYAVGGRIWKTETDWSINTDSSPTGPFSLSELPEGMTTGMCVIAVYQGVDLANKLPLQVFSVIKQ